MYFLVEQQENVFTYEFLCWGIEFLHSLIAMRQLTLSADTGTTWKEIMTFYILAFWGKQEERDPAVAETHNQNTVCVIYSPFKPNWVYLRAAKCNSKAVPYRILLIEYSGL